MTVAISAFRRRPGRVIALGRVVVIAGAFLASAVAGATIGYDRDDALIAIGIYLAWALFVLAAGWNDWWFDHRWSGIAHGVDLIALGGLVVTTGGYSSPLLTLILFIVLAAVIRWSWQQAAASFVVAALILYLAGSIAADQAATAFDASRAVTRLTSAAVLAVLVIWVGYDRTTAASGAAMAIGHHAGIAATEAVLRRIAGNLGARRLMLLWREAEDLSLARLEDGRFTQETADPARATLIDAAKAEGPTVFDRPRRRAISQVDGVALARHGAAVEEIADTLAAPTGIIVPISAQDADGVLLIAGVEGMCVDDLAAAAAAGRAIAGQFDQAAVARASAMTAVERANLALACDVHDSVVQTLAGTAFRLEALKSWIARGADAVPEIDRLTADVRKEQNQVRAFIARLREPMLDDTLRDLRATIERLTDELCRQWKVDCDFDGGPDPVMVAEWLERECEFFVREGFSNAVRHGGAGAVAVDLAREDDTLKLEIHDDGRGFLRGADGEEMPRPWSMYERVKRLGGTLDVVSGPGSRLTLRLPMEES